MKQNKLRKTIILLILLVIAGVGVAFVIQQFGQKEVATIVKNVRIVRNMLENETIKDETMEEKYCEYSTNDNGKITINTYSGREECLTIPEKLAEFEVDSIQSNAFENCRNLEMIKIPVKIAKNINEILDFEKSDELSDNEYIVYVTIKEYNEQYLKYRNLPKKQKQNKKVIPPKFLTPLKKTNNLAKSQMKSARATSIPSSYDLRNRITISIDDQNPLNNCYAYSALNCVESNLALKSGTNKDFSEIHAAVMSRQGSWGNFDTTYYDYLRLGNGPVDETSGTILSKSKIINKSDEVSRIIYNYCYNRDLVNDTQLQTAVNALSAYSPTYQVMEYKEFPSITTEMKNNSSYASIVEQTRNEMKNHIMTNGSISIAIADPNDTSICTKRNGYQVMKSPEGDGTSHLVNIIGWDDNFSKSNFTSSMGVKNNGAWLVQNSWGTSWGNNGYFWISYEDYYAELYAYGITEVSNGKVNLQNTSIILSPTVYTYNGNAKIPSVTVSYANSLLGRGVDYTVSYSNNTNAGTATATFTGIGRYTGTVQKTFQIRAKDMSSCTATISQSSYQYDGSAKQPSVTVKDGSKTLSLNNDYTVSYSNNTNAGTARVTITGKGNYTGSTTLNFTITKLDIDASATGGSYTYDGNAHGITVRVTKPTSGATIKYATTKGNYNLNASPTYTNVGTYKVYGIVQANNYNNKEVEATVTINAKNISSANITLSNNTFDYDGTAKQPTVTVKDGNRTLALNTDYTVSYSNHTNVGTATLTVTGKGNYTGTKSVTYTIRKASIEETVTGGNCTYDGNAHGITVRVTKPASGATVKYATVKGNYNLNASPTYTDIGTYKVYYLITANNYNNKEAEATITINAKNVNSCTTTISQSSYQYDGIAKQPTVTVKDGSKTLSLNNDYTVEYVNNINAGIATVIITGKGNYTGTITKNFTIEGLNMSGNVAGYTGIYDGKAHGIAINVVEPASGATIKYATSAGNYTLDVNPTYTDVGTYKVYYKVTATNYKEITGEQTIKINPKDISGFSVKLSNDTYKYDGTAKQPEITIKDKESILQKDKDYTVEYTNNTNIGTASLTITGKGNYRGTITNTYTIVKGDIEIQLEGYHNTYDQKEHGIKVTVSKPTSGVTIKYGTSAEDCILDKSPTYTNVGTYQVYYKVVADSYEDLIGVETIKILPRDINTTTITLSEKEYIYDTLEKKPKITVQDGEKMLEEVKDYKIEYTNNKDVGTATVSIIGQGNYNKTVVGQFTIKKGNHNYTVPSGLVTAYGNTLKDVKLPENFTWEDDINTPVGEIGYHKFKCTYTPDDTKNYNVETGIEVTIKVTEKLEINFEKYSTKMSEDEKIMYIREIQEADTIKDIKDSIETNGEIEVYDKQGRKITQEEQELKTGMKVQVCTEAEKVEYILVITGDINGDGRVSGVDLLKLARFIIDIDKEVKGEYLLASDIYEDEKVNNSDLLKLARVLVGLDTID